MTTSFLHGVETIEVNDGVRPVKINKSGTIAITGTADNCAASVFPLNTPVPLFSSPRKAALLANTALTSGQSNTLYQAVKQIYAQCGAAISIVRVASSSVAATQMANIVGDSTARTGIYAHLQARDLCGFTPRTFIAPGFTSQRPSGAANPAVGAMLTLAARLRGRVYADMPTAYADVLTYRADFDDARLVGFWPTVRIWDETTGTYIDAPQSATQAGLTAKVHNQLGFWFSPSNQVLAGGDGGVGGITTPVDWGIDDENCMANVLNDNDINVVVNGGDDYAGWRRWGNHTFATDPLWQFEPVRTALDMVYEAVQAAQLYAVDKPPSVNLLREMAQMVQAFFDYGKKTGFLIGGRVWLDQERNTPQQTSQGIWAWDFDPEAPAPMEHIQNYAHRNTGYYKDLVAAVVQTLNSQGLAG